MKHINEFNTFTGQEVANHIEYITPESSDIPDYFIDKYILPNNGWKNKSIKLKDLLKDKDFKEYYKSGEERYGEYEVSGDDLYQELVVYKGKLLDGYSRAARMLRLGEKTAAAFVLEKQNLVIDMKNLQTFEDFVNEREYSEEERTEMADKGEALPDGSYPIADKADLENAIKAYGRAKNQSAAAKHIAKRAKALGLEDMIPDTADFQKSLKS